MIICVGHLLKTWPSARTSRQSGKVFSLAAAGLCSWCPMWSLPIALPLPTLLQALLRGSMRKAFGGFDLWMLGLGLVVATGWATLTGSAAQQYAG